MHISSMLIPSNLKPQVVLAIILSFSVNTVKRWVTLAPIVLITRMAMVEMVVTKGILLLLLLYLLPPGNGCLRLQLLVNLKP